MNFAFLTTALIAPLGLIGGCGSESSQSGSTSGSEGGVPVDDASAFGDVMTDGGGGSSGSGSEGGGSTASGSVSDASVSDGSVGDASVSDASAGDGSARDSSARPCEMQACFRSYECVTVCGGPVTNTGCCPCEPPAFDRITCNVDAAEN
jgi:hypothetical protein